MSDLNRTLSVRRGYQIDKEDAVELDQLLSKVNKILGKYGPEPFVSYTLDENKTNILPLYTADNKLTGKHMCYSLIDVEWDKIDSARKSRITL